MQQDPMSQQVKELAELNQLPQKSSNIIGTILVLLVFISGLGVAGYAGYDWYKNRSTKLSEEPETTTTPAPTSQPIITSVPSPIPSPSPLVSFSISSLKIEILNGSGVAGLAGNAKLVLEESGYKNIQTGNAQNYEYEQTIIMAKKDKQSTVPALQDILKKTYSIDEQKNILDESNPNDIVIIIGKK